MATDIKIHQDIITTTQKTSESTLVDVQVLHSQSSTALAESQTILEDSKQANRQTYQLKSEVSDLRSIFENKLEQINEVYEHIDEQSHDIDRKHNDFESVLREIQSKVEWTMNQNQQIAQTHEELLREGKIIQTAQEQLENMELRSKDKSDYVNAQINTLTQLTSEAKAQIAGRCSHAYLVQFFISALLICIPLTHLLPFIHTCTRTYL